MVCGTDTEEKSPRSRACSAKEWTVTNPVDGALRPLCDVVSPPATASRADIQIDSD